MSINVKDRKITFQLSVRREVSDTFEEIMEIAGLDRNEVGEEAILWVIEKYNPKDCYNELIQKRDAIDLKIRALDAKIKADEENDKKLAEDYINKIFTDKKYSEQDADYCITVKWLGTIHNGLQEYGMNADESRVFLVNKINGLKSQAQRDMFKVAAMGFWGSEEGIN
jgi:hypothetical protein